MPRPRRSTTAQPKEVIAIAHKDDSRRNNPTAEMEPVMDEAVRNPVRVAYERRNRDLDPQLVWRGKDEQDLSDLIVAAPPLFTQEKVHPKVLVDDLIRVSKQRKAKGEKAEQPSLDLFADFNGLDDPNARTEFYEHDQHWSNRMILGDSLQVMASLAEREDLRGQVQCIYIDPPYGIRFNSNFQWSTTSRDVRDGNVAHITREPEQVKAFRDTWRHGIHSYLTYLRDRLTVARDLLADSGSIFVQIGDENVHRVRAVMDEVFGEDNFVSQITYRRGGFQTSQALPNTSDFILWFSKSSDRLKFRHLYTQSDIYDWYSGQQKWIESSTGDSTKYVDGQSIPEGWRLHSHRAAQSASSGESSVFAVDLEGSSYMPARGRGWSTNHAGFRRLMRSQRLLPLGRTLRFKSYYYDFPTEDFDKWMERHCNERFRRPESIRRPNWNQYHPTLHSDDHRPWRPRARPHLRLRHHRLRCRAMGPTMDHHRHFPRCPGPGPRAHHGGPLPVLPIGRQSSGTT